MIDSKSKMKGCISIKVYDKDGTLKDSRKVENKIVMDGCRIIASLLANDGRIPHPATVGCGGYAYDAANGSSYRVPAKPSINDGALENEIVRVPFSKEPECIDDLNSVMFEATFLPGTPNKENTSISEVAIFSAPDAKSRTWMLNRATFAVINKAYEDTVVVNWIVTVLSDSEDNVD